MSMVRNFIFVFGLGGLLTAAAGCATTELRGGKTDTGDPKRLVRRLGTPAIVITLDATKARNHGRDARATKARNHGRDARATKAVNEQ